MNPELAVAVSRLTFLRAGEKRSLYRAVPNVETLSRLSRDDIGDVIGRRLLTRAWDPAKLPARAERDAAFLARRGVSLVGFGEPGYPPWLTEIYDPPFLLFLSGAPLPITRPLLAIVGTRSPTHAGRTAARRLGREAAQTGVPVVSGLARGIDTEAHRGAVEGGGATVAVLGCGIDIVYPAQNRMLVEQLLTGGGSVVSEYPPGTPPRQFNFPERNRIISGLARGVVVVEAPERSGALITADYALDQGRELLVHEVAEASPRAAGARALVGFGAQIVSGMRDVLRQWGSQAPAASTAGEGAADAAADPSDTVAAGRQLALELEAELSGGGHG